MLQAISKNKRISWSLESLNSNLNLGIVLLSSVANLINGAMIVIHDYKILVITTLEW